MDDWDRDGIRSEPLTEEQITKDLARLREPRKPPPSDRALRRAVRIATLIDQQSNLEHRLLLPTTPEQEADIYEKLQAVNNELTKLSAEEQAEQQEPPEPQSG